jgi:hypothetical protein
LTGLAVAIMAVADQGAGLPPEIAAADVVEHQSAVGQVPLGQLGLDGLLAPQEPIHGGIEFVLGDVLEVEFLCERGVLPVAGCGQLGAGEEEELGDQGGDEVALPRGAGGDEGVEAEATDQGKDRFDVAIGWVRRMRKVSAAGTKVSLLRERRIKSMR